MGQLTKNEIFALAVQRYSDTVFRAAMHNCSCTADAEDVVQDVFEKLLCYNGRFESEEHLKAWLLRVTINRCHDLTRAARQKDTELDENLPAPDQMEDGSVLDAVRALPENYRNAVYLHYYEGYTAAEVGRMLGAPTNTVLSWLRRARAQLHTMLKEEIEESKAPRHAAGGRGTETRQETEKSHPLSPQGSEHRRLRPALRRWSVCSSPLPHQPAACGRRGPQLCP